MSMLQRISNFISGLLSLLSGIVILLVPELGFRFAMLILGFSLLISGLRTVIFFFRMARHMVGGRSMLYYGVITMDFGVFTLTLTDMPRSAVSHAQMYFTPKSDAAKSGVACECRGSQGMYISLR